MVLIFILQLLKNGQAKELNQEQAEAGQDQ